MQLMPLILKAVSIVLVAVFALSVALLVLTFRKPRRVSVTSLCLAMLIGVVTPVIFSLLIRYRPSLPVLAVMGIAGLLTGIVWSRATRVYVADGQVMSRNSVWYIVVWGGIFSMTQLISIFTNRPPDVVMALLIMSTATVIGMNSSIIARSRTIKAGAPAREAAAGALPKARRCSACGALSGSGDAFCSSCGKRLGE